MKKKEKMNSMKVNSPIEKIHEQGLQAIIDGDKQKIVGTVHPDMVSEKIASLQTYFDDVSEDADGDIVFYRES